MQWRVLSNCLAKGQVMEVCQHASQVNPISIVRIKEVKVKKVIFFESNVMLHQLQLIIGRNFSGYFKISALHLATLRFANSIVMQWHSTINSPFYSCALSVLVFKYKRGWRIPFLLQTFPFSHMLMNIFMGLLAPRFPQVRVRTESWILEKVWRYIQQFSWPGKGLESMVKSQ